MVDGGRGGVLYGWRELGVARERQLGGGGG